MTIVVDEEFRRGGKTLLDFLAFCVISIRMEPVFAFLVGEYRQRPTRQGVLTLYDAFCAPAAPARLRHPSELLPPRNVRFSREVDAFRDLAPATPPAQAGEGEPEVAVPSRHLMIPPPRYLFDFLIDAMRRGDSDPIAAAGALFDPALSPVENLPGGRMTPAQRDFVERVWQPIVRPELVRAGFWKIANVG